MLTTIKTTELLKIIDPINDGVLYQNETIKIDLEVLRKYVEKPKTNKVFSPSSDPSESLHKNIAIYIINANANKVVSIDLNKENVIEQGLFEYVKNIYQNEEFTYISLPENDNNNILIKSKKLVNIENDLFNDSQMEFAHDNEIVNCSPVFERTQKSNDKFFWKGEEVDKTSSSEFVLSKLQEVFNLPANQQEADFYRIIGNANKELVNSNEFKSKLLENSPPSLFQILLKNPDHKAFNIDFKSPIVTEHILSKVKLKEFNLLELVFVRNEEIFKENANLSWRRLRDEEAKRLDPIEIEYSKIVQQPEVIEHLLTKSTYSIKCVDRESKSLSVVSCYPYFTPEQQEDEKIIDKYLNHISDRDYTNSYRFNEKLLYKLPLKLFNDPKFVLSICNFRLDHKEIKVLLKENNIKPTLLGDTTFILNLLKLSNPHNLGQWISTFVKKENITTDFVKEIILSKNEFYDDIQQLSKFNHVNQNFDLIVTAINNGYHLNRIDFKLMKDHLLIDSENADHENIKVKYVLSNNFFKYGKKLYKVPEDVEKFNSKYVKPENMYYCSIGNSLHEDKLRSDTLNQVHTSEEVLNILKKIVQGISDCGVDTQSFYEELHPPLKKNKQIVQALNLIKPLSYRKLDEQLQMNSELFLEFVKLDNENAKHTPVEFFRDRNFSLEFAKLMDTSIPHELLPPIVIKFFDSQNVQEKYYDYLKKYLTFHELHENMDAVEAPKKKMKI